MGTVGRLSVSPAVGLVPGTVNNDNETVGNAASNLQLWDVCTVMVFLPDAMRRFPHPREWAENMRNNIKLCKDASLQGRALELVDIAAQASAADMGARLHAWVPFRKDDLGAWCSDGGRVTALGDAAHLMPPTLGWGANCAMGDARKLANEIMQMHESGGAGVAIGLKSYEDSRKVAVAPLVAASVREAERLIGGK